MTCASRPWLCHSMGLALLPNLPTGSPTAPCPPSSHSAIHGSVIASSTRDLAGSRRTCVMELSILVRNRHADRDVIDSPDRMTGNGP